MSFFRKKQLPPAEDVRKILPQARSEALAKVMDKRLGRKDLKKDLARYMENHRGDKLDTRRIAKTFKFKGKVTEE